MPSRSIIIWLQVLLGSVWLCLLGACRQLDQPAAASPPARVEQMNVAGMEYRITAQPAEVRLDRDVLLTIQIKAPIGALIQLSSLTNRLQGFVLSGAYDQEPVALDGFVTYEHNFKLTPTLTDEYRLGALAVNYLDHSRAPPQTNWFATQPILFKSIPLTSASASTASADILGPAWIHPSWQVVLLWSFVLLLLGLLSYGIYKLGRRMRRHMQLRRMTPKERAQRELAELLAKDLIAHSRFKEFYLEITAIVRRYIERAHAIRAPEQTTEEFLAAVTQDHRFQHAVVLKLQMFLQTADLVKFAALRPDRPTIDKTVSTARDYLETDEQSLKSQEDNHV